jgi:hypothetical protein
MKKTYVFLFIIISTTIAFAQPDAVSKLREFKFDALGINYMKEVDHIKFSVIRKNISFYSSISIDSFERNAECVMQINFRSNWMSALNQMLLKMLDTSECQKNKNIYYYNYYYGIKSFDKSGNLIHSLYIDRLTACAVMNGCHVCLDKKLCDELKRRLDNIAQSILIDG